MQPRAGESNGGPVWQGQARKGPTCLAKELRVCGEVSREPERFILPGPTWSDVPLRKLAWTDVGRMDYCK